MKILHIFLIPFLCVLVSQYVYAQKLNNIPINTIKESNNEDIVSGNEKFMNGDYYGALNTYMEGIKRNEYVAYFNMGVTYYVIGNYKKAEDCFINALKINKKNIDAELNLAYTYIMLGKINQAEDILIKYIDKLENPSFYVNLANLFLEKGNTAKAYFYLIKALNSKPDDFYTQLSLANYLAAIGDKNRSMQILEGLHSEGYFENFNIARAYFNLEDYLKSNNYLKKASIYSETAEIYDLMAKNYALLNERSMQVDSLKRLVGIDNSQYNKINYAVAMFCMNDEDQALDYIKNIIKNDKNQLIFKHLYYDLLISGNNINDARSFVENLYKSTATPENLYIYVKHLLTSGNRSDLIKARQLIYSKPSNNYMTLAHIILNIKDKKYSEGLRKIDNIKYQDLNDFQREEYNILRSILNLNSNRFNNALDSAKKIPYYRGEYFWINFIVYWNLRDFNRALNAIKIGHYSCLNNKKTKKIKININPSLLDMNLSFIFYERPVDIMENLLYPIFMDANEILEILRFGSKLAKTYNVETALTTLSRSLAFTEAIDKNNKAVFNILKGDYTSALKYLVEANSELENNPVILFNLGITYKFLGDIVEALRFFEMSISSNRYFYPASIAKAGLYAKYGRITEANNILENVYYAFDSHVSDISQLPLYIKYTEYLAGIGLEKYDSVESKLKNVKKTQYDELILAAVDYLRGNKLKSLEKMRSIKTFRSIYLHDFLSLYNGRRPLGTDNINDRVYRFTIYFIEANRGQKPTIVFNKNDKYEVKEAIYYNILFRQYNEALSNIRQLSELDPNFPMLYEATLYYFIIIDDIVNSEGAYNSLVRSNSDNLFSQYYKLLYLLYNGDLKNIENNLFTLKSDYPSSIKGHVLYVIYSFLKGDLEGIKSSLNYISEHYENYEKRININFTINDL